MKRLRQKTILELVRSGNIASQEDLLRDLLARRIEVSQSTLSRDIQELRLAKTGGVYTVMNGDPPRANNDSLRRIVKEFVVGIEAAQNIVVVKTGSGNASTVSQALDEADLAGAIGSIAGENTIFIAAVSAKDAQKLEKRLRSLLQ